MTTPTPTATLTALQAAEARLAGTIQQTAAAVNGIGANTQAALAQLAAALDNARARLAVDLTTFAEMMGEAFASFDAAADMLAAPLAFPAPVLPALPTRELSDLDKPTAPVQAPAAGIAVNEEPLIDLTEALTSEPTATTHNVVGYCTQGRQNAQQARQDVQTVEPGRELFAGQPAPAVAIEVDPGNPAAAVREFVASLDGATPAVEETVTAAELVRRGVLTQNEADGIARQGEKFTAAANPPGESADQRRRRSAPQKSGGRTKRPAATPTPGNSSAT